MINLPLSQRNLLAEMKGKRLERVIRILLPCDFESLPAEERDQLSDGSLDLYFEGGFQISFWSFTEQMSVGIVTDGQPVPDWVRRDVSENDFWRGIIGQTVLGVTVCKAPVRDKFGAVVFASEFGVLIDLSHDQRFLVEYSMDFPYPDTLRVMPNEGHIPLGTYDRVTV